MTLDDWLESRWIHEHQTGSAEVAELLSLVDRDLADAAIDRLSADWRLGIAYNAALQLAKLALAAEGYRVGHERSHERTIESLRLTAGVAPELVDLLDAIRRKRNTSNYDRAGTTSATEAHEGYELALQIKQLVLDWLELEHPELL